jgi:gliding motility-associated-like protein
MRYFINIYILILTTGNVFPQSNLLTNGDFEDFTGCPAAAGQLSLATGWFQPNNIISVFSGSTEYYNSCSTNPNFSVPINWIGHQIAYTGNGYSHILTYSLNNNYREYIETMLVRKMKKDKKYCIDFYVSLADTCIFASNNIGVYFSIDTLLYSSATFQNITVIPQVNFTSIISDKINWSLLSAEYVAQGGEQFITIGNFYNDTSTSVLSVGPAVFYSAYYIDNIRIICCNCEPEVPNIFSPNGDGINDLLEIQNMSEEATIKIYDRWGVKVFESTKKGSFWDGRTTSGVTCNEGVYYYIISTPDDNYRGCIQLVK